jgi:hypothetical protein
MARGGRQYDTAAGAEVEGDGLFFSLLQYLNIFLGSGRDSVDLVVGQRKAQPPKQLSLSTSFNFSSAHDILI